MTNSEFSDAFDVAVQAYNPHIQFDEYEKSVFLTKAQNIIDYRNENGLFKSIEDLKNVTGISEKLFEQIKEFITI